MLRQNSTPIWKVLFVAFKWDQNGTKYKEGFTLLLKLLMLI